MVIPANPTRLVGILKKFTRGVHSIVDCYLTDVNALRVYDHGELICDKTDEE
jgi:hypothetical protein